MYNSGQIDEQILHRVHLRNVGLKIKKCINFMTMIIFDP